MAKSNPPAFIKAHREGYTIEQVGKTMSVGELIDYLEENCDRNSPIYISNDNGYTYGAIIERYILT